MSYGRGDASLRDSVAATPADDTAAVVQYLRTAVLFVASSGIVRDVLDPAQPIVAAGHLMTDGEWVWPSYLVHYVAKYNVTLPNEFLAAMKARNFKPPAENEVDVRALAFTEQNDVGGHD